MKLNVVFDLSPRLVSLAEKYMATLAEFEASILQKLTDLQTAAANEHTQVVAAIQALQDQINSLLAGQVPDQVVTDVNAAFDATDAAVAGVYNPPAPAPPPAP